MPAVSVTPADLAPFADVAEGKAVAMIADALAMARLVAPCIDDADFKHADAAKAVLRGAILRWNDAGSGVLTQHTDTAGPFSSQQSYDTRQARRSLFWPSEIDQLKKLCESQTNTAWGYDTLPDSGPSHSLVCAINFGGNYCSCGADLTQGDPLWEKDTP